MKREQRGHFSCTSFPARSAGQRRRLNVLQCASYRTQARNTSISWHYACKNTSTYNIFFRALCFLVLLYLVYSQKKFICIRAQAFMEYINPLINNSLYRSSTFCVVGSVWNIHIFYWLLLPPHSPLSFRRLKAVEQQKKTKKQICNDVENCSFTL